MFDNPESRTELSRLGEFGLIDHIAKGVEIKHAASLKGIGDDAAVIDSEGLLTLVSTDMLVEGVHFDLSYCPIKHLGYKAVVANVSDIYAMNGLAKHITVSIALSNRFSVEAIQEFYEGVHLACDHYEVDLIGGDTSSSHAGLIISITAIGVAKKEDIVYRNTAKENDLICVTGDLGAAFAGLKILDREKKIHEENSDIQPDFAGYEYVIERQLKPEARWDMLERMKEAKLKPTSMIDISDGLASEVLHICKDSEVGCVIYEEKVPVDAATCHAAEDLGLSPTVCALSGGEDYELLFTVSLGDFDKVKALKGVSIIGHITEKSAGMYFTTTGGSAIPLETQGWDAFLDKGE